MMQKTLSFIFDNHFNDKEREEYSIKVHPETPDEDQLDEIFDHYDFIYIDGDDIIY